MAHLKSFTGFGGASRTRDREKQKKCGNVCVRERYFTCIKTLIRLTSGANVINEF